MLRSKADQRFDSVTFCFLLLYLVYPRMHPLGSNLFCDNLCSLSFKKYKPDLSTESYYLHLNFGACNRLKFQKNWKWKSFPTTWKRRTLTLLNPFWELFTIGWITINQKIIPSEVSVPISKLTLPIRLEYFRFLIGITCVLWFLSTPEIWKLPCFDIEVPEPCYRKWKDYYCQYREEMSVAMDDDGKERRNAKADEIIREYKKVNPFRIMFFGH